MQNDLFANFNKPASRVIIYATEEPINKPHNVNAQSSTFFSNKKYTEGNAWLYATLSCNISYISDANCDSAGDI